MRRRTKPVAAAAAAVAGALALTGCGYEGLNSMSLPGTKGGGGYEIKAEFQNMANLVENQPVLVNDINVGTITDIELRDWTPVATMKVEKDIKLPANTIATIGQTSLLGAKHIQLAPPKNEPPQGELQDGDLIPLARTHNAPETEDVLASVSLLLNGGGLQHIDTIARELNRAIGGRAEDYRALFTELNTFIGGLNEQKGDIVGAIESLNRLADNLNTGMPQIEAALDSAPQALGQLAEERKAISTFFGDFGFWNQSIPAWDQLNKNLGRMLTGRDVGTEFPASRRVDGGLEAMLVALADSGESIVESLRQITGVLFPLDGVAASFKGDQPMFSQTIIDLTLPMIDKNFLTGTPFEGALTNADKFLELLSGRSDNPLTAPLGGAGVPLSGVTQAPSELLGGLLPGLGGGN